METRVLPADDPQALAEAAALLKGGGVVAFPTDTVYGLGAWPFDENAVARLYAIKGRPQQKAIPILLASAEELEQVASWPDGPARRLAARFWPGPLTLVVPRRPEIPDIISPLRTVGVRVPDHPAALALLRLTGPLAVTSANRSGAANAATAEEVLAQLGGQAPLILDGGTTPGGTPSTVVEASGTELKILREGPLSREELLAAAG